MKLAIANNYGFQMIIKTITYCAKIGLQYSGPFPAKLRPVEMSIEMFAYPWLWNYF